MALQFVYLHGPPASGKLTIARVLEQATGFRVFHNHLTIEPAKVICGFGSAAFYPLLRELRLACIQAAVDVALPGLVYTSCYSEPQDRPFVEEIEQILRRGGGQLRPVFLRCATATLESRVAAESRELIGKLANVEDFRAEFPKWNFAPLPHPNCIQVENDHESPDQTASEIQRRLSL